MEVEATKTKFPDKQFHMVIQADVRVGLAKLPESSIDCVVTSPPYWGLRDYKIEPTVWDGTEGCEHDFSVYAGPRRERKESDIKNPDSKQATIRGSNFDLMGTNFCSKCSAWNGQLGLEPTFQLYIKHVISVFHEVKRVLKPTGTLFLNLGDTYSGSDSRIVESGGGLNRILGPHRGNEESLPAKCLIGIPERIMLAMIDDGWILRNKIVWAKPNHMPSSVKDRFSNGWESIFFFVKAPRYWFDLDAVREPHTESGIERRRYGLPDWRGDPRIDHKEQSWVQSKGNEIQSLIPVNPSGKNPGKAKWYPFEAQDLWTITTQPFAEAHFATFPEALPERAIKAGCSAEVCVKCGMTQLTKRSGGKPAFNIRVRDVKEGRIKGSDRLATQEEVDEYDEETYIPELTITEEKCNCAVGFRPGIVLDPFAGSGTVALVAKRLQRSSVSIEIKPAYCEMLKRRIDFGHETVDGAIEWIETS